MIPQHAYETPELIADLNRAIEQRRWKRVKRDATKLLALRALLESPVTSHISLAKVPL